MFWTYGKKVFVEILRKAVVKSSIQLVAAVRRTIDGHTGKAEQKRFAVRIEQIGYARLFGRVFGLIRIGKLLHLSFL